MNPILRELRELAHLRSDADPVVSLYLNTRWSDEMQRERVRLFVRQKVRQARASGWNAGLSESLDRVERFVEGLCRQAHDENARGMAIFACRGLGLWKTIAAQRSFEPQFGLAETPLLFQLARTVEDFEPLVVAMVDARGARVFETAVGELVTEARIVRSAPKRHSMGGWSQLRFQHRIDQQIERNLERAAMHVAYLVQTDPAYHVVLAGPHELVREFEAHLPAFVRERIIGTQPNPHLRGARRPEVKDELIAGAIERLTAWERAVEEDRANRVVGEALAGGLAVVGTEDVVLAANEERVHVLVIAADFAQTGWRCRTCEALAARGPIECAYCGGAVDPVDLGEALVRRSLRAGAEVDVVEPHPRLRHYQGVGAFLRHRGSLQTELGVTSRFPPV